VFVAAAEVGGTTDGFGVVVEVVTVAGDGEISVEVLVVGVGVATTGAGAPPQAIAAALTSSPRPTSIRLTPRYYADLTG
jgi:hypothetical protein